MVLSIKISEKVDYLNFKPVLVEKLNAGIESIELDIYRHSNNQLILFLQEDLSATDQVVYLNDVFRYLSRINSPVHLVLNFIEPNLEALTILLVKKWGIQKQVTYTGKLIPTVFSPWDRLHIHYNVERCIPNYYQLAQIKRTHFDVIHYFLRKEKVKVIRMHVRGLTEDIICWAAENEIGLSIYGVTTQEEASLLFEKKVDTVSTTNEKIFLNEPQGV